MDASKLKKYFDDPAVVDARILIDYREEHLLTKKDVLFIKKYGVIMHTPTSEITLENRFFNAVIDAIFYKFRGKSICFNYEIISDLTRLPIVKVKKMFEERVEKNVLEVYKRKKPTRLFYVNPYEKDYY
jgi:hypothetical protein